MFYLMYAPIKYKLAFIYDHIGNDIKAYEYYKYFYSIYKDCDDFYQDNVAYAKGRIEYYESVLPADN